MSGSGEEQPVGCPANWTAYGWFLRRCYSTPGERLFACYNPLLAEKRRQKRAALLAATEAKLAKLAQAVGQMPQDPDQFTSRTT